MLTTRLLHLSVQVVMEVVVDFKDAHLLTKVSLVTISVADLILLIGVSTNYWYHESYRYLIHLGNPHFGLWRGGYYLCK